MGGTLFAECGHAFFHKGLKAHGLAAVFERDHRGEAGVLCQGQAVLAPADIPGCSSFAADGLGECGFAVACLPQEGFGVRIENTVLVTGDGQLDLMAGIPIEADEIEALMNRSK